MKRLITYLTIVLSLGALFVGCRRQDDKTFSFFLNGAPVTEGTPLLMTATLESGDGGEYVFGGLVARFVGENYEEVDAGFSIAGKQLMDGDVVSFYNNRLQFAVQGLDAGTYRVSVTLSRDDVSSTVSCICVVQKDQSQGGEGGGGDGSGTETEVHVSDFSIPVESGSTVKMTVGGLLKHKVVFSPVNATDQGLLVSSDRPSVASAVFTGGFLEVEAVNPGQAQVSVTAESGKGISKSFVVEVAAKDIAVDDFTVPSADDSGYLQLAHGNDFQFRPTITPADATLLDFVVATSDENIVTGKYEDGLFVIHPVAPGRASVSFAVNGMTKTVSVLVYKEVKVNVKFVEVTSSELQTKTKTEPCSLWFSSDSNIEFPGPMTWSVTVKQVITLSGHDTKTNTVKQDIHFYGNRDIDFDIAGNVLVPGYNIWKSNDYNYTLSLSLVLSNPLDQSLWRVTVDNEYLTQEAAIKRYIVEYIQ